MPESTPIVESSEMDGQKDFTIEVGNSVNFDDLDNIQAARTEYVKVKEDEAREAIKKKESEDAKGTASEDSKEKKPDGDKPKETEGEKKPDEGAAEKSAEKKEPEKVEKPVKKLLEGKLGEEKYAVDPDMQIPVKIDGKTEYVSLKDLTGNFSGKTSWDKKFSELDKDRKGFKSEKEQYVKEKDLVVNHMRAFYQKINDPKTPPIDAVNYLIDLMDGDKHTVYRRFWDSFFDEINQMGDLSEQSIEAHMLKKENEFLRKARESKDVRFKEQQSQQEMLSKVHQVREAHNVSVEDFDEAYRDLVESGVEKKSLTAEIVCDHSSKIKAVDRSFELVKRFDPSLVDSEDGEKLIRKLAKFIHRGTELSDEELIESLKEEYGQTSSGLKELSKKIDQSEETTPQAKTKNKKSYESFEDYDD
jgi:hypothetical protein